jgi:hypothetical protein
MPLLDEFPPDMYCLLEGEQPMYGDFPDLKKCVGRFVAQLPKDEWRIRRNIIAKRFYKSLIGDFVDVNDKGRYFDDTDIFG